MNGIEVEYIDHMGSDLRVSNVARVSFDNWKFNLDNKDVKLINYLAEHEHTSPFRHAVISVRCTAPLFVARQLGKHQVGLSWNEVSRRYVDAEPKFFFPEEWRSRPDGGIKQGSGTVLYDQASPRTLYQFHIRASMELYNDLLGDGIAPEMARMVLPQSMLTTWIWTGSIQAFFHLWRLRADGHAQLEAQEFANHIDSIMGDTFPHCWAALKENA